MGIQAVFAPAPLFLAEQPRQLYMGFENPEPLPLSSGLTLGNDHLNRGGILRGQMGAEE
jgi:hypothetical protein